MMATAHTAPWQERLYIPAYRVGEAARYARTSAKTAADWQRLRGNRTNVLSPRMRGSGLSYLQLIELGVVAAMRKSGVPLSKVRQAREYLAGQLETDFPFAQYRFKTDGKSLFLDYEQVEGHSEVQKLLALNKQGQFEWSEIIDDLLREFEYDDETVLRWNVAGLGILSLERG